ncbi:MAG: glycosyltransferase family 2 protein [Nanoarchaeota archaeon]|nr:glycosyltransferase family 2 protein [Nanoarchaeota archaeon]MBU1135675.1 glycosyltransferase family 2 protein [Nanoarchaeota archaeon]MBU2520549.1 glycosyltransferase family 2 protein [Nanoarchaeota archaeon]
MYRNKKISVAMPAYNEEKLIEKAIKSIPDFVDKLIVVDDDSKDNTFSIAKKYEGKRVTVIKHTKNQGVGGAIITGFKEALKEKADIAVVMAGDAQMDPNDLPNILDPIVNNVVDCTKGNRFLHPEIYKKMPKFRLFGNRILTILTKISSGYYHISDPQNGYVAVSRNVLETIDWGMVDKRFSFENDMLIHLNVNNFSVKNIKTNPIYGEEKSKIKIHSFALKLSFLLIKKFFWRIKEKYFVRDFHPTFIFFIAGFIMLFFGLIWSLLVLRARFITPDITCGSVVLSALLLICGSQSIFTGFILDMYESKTLKT